MDSGFSGRQAAVARVANQLHPKLAAFMDDAEPDVLAFMSFPKDHRAKIYSTNPLERVIGEGGRHLPQ